MKPDTTFITLHTFVIGTGHLFTFQTCFLTLRRNKHEIVQLFFPSMTWFPESWEFSQFFRTDCMTVQGFPLY